MFKDLIDKLRQIIGGTDVHTPDVGIKIDRLKIAKLSRKFTSEFINKEVIENTIQNVKLPSDIANVFKSVLTLYQTVPEIHQAITILVDNILAPDNITKKSLRVVTYNVNEENERETYEKMVNTIIYELDIEEILETLCRHFILFGNAYIEILDRQPILKQYKLLDNEDILKTFSNRELRKTISNLTILIDENTKTYEYVPPEMLIKENEHLEINENEKLTEDELIKNLSKSLDALNDTSFREKLRNIKPVLQYLDLKILEPQTIVPIYINDILIGAFEITTQIKKAFTTAQTLDIRSGEQVQAYMKLISMRVANIIYKNIAHINHLKKYVNNSGDLASIIASILEYYQYSLLNAKQIRFIPAEKIVHFRIPSVIFNPFGEPYILGILNHAKFLVASEYAQIIYRLTRAPERRLFRVNIGQDRRASKYIEDIISETKRKEYAIRSGSIDALINEVTMFEDYYIPVQEGEATMEIDTVPGGDLTSRIEDLDYFRKKVISGLGIPPIYLIQEDTSESKYTLAQENVKFARTILRLQKLFAVGLNDLLLKLFVLIFGIPEMIEKVELQLKPPKAIQMEREAEVLQNLSTIISTLKEMAGDILDVKTLTLDYIQEIFDLPYIKDYKLGQQAEQTFSKKSGEEEEEV